jgi:hypothetical protein
VGRNHRQQGDDLMAALPQIEYPNIGTGLAAYGQMYGIGQKMHEANALAKAGGLYAGGDKQGAVNALAQAGQLGEATALEKSLRDATRQADADKLAKAALFNEKLGNLAMLADTPEKWAAAIGHAKQAGLDVDKYADFGTRDFVLAQAGKANEVLKQELDRRKVEVSAAAKTAGGKPPAGYRYTPEGDLTFIPGGPADPAHVKPRQFSVTDVTKLSEEGTKFGSLTQSADTFKDNFAGYYSDAVGDIAMAAGRKGLTGKETQEAASWWQGYERMRNVVRHELYGSALTPQEKETFERADITPGMKPELVRTNLKTQTGIIQNGLRRKANALIQSGYDPGAISAAYGLDLGELGVNPAGRGSPAPSVSSGAPRQEQQASPFREYPQAKQAPDGHWYVEQNGKFFRVDQ